MTWRHRYGRLCNSLPLSMTRCGSGSGDDFRQVTDARLQTMLSNAVGEMDDACRAGGGDDVGPG